MYGCAHAFVVVDDLTDEMGDAQTRLAQISEHRRLQALAICDLFISLRVFG